MAYCLATDVLSILPGLPQTATSAGYSATVAVIDSHIPRADAIINGKCARRYSLPFADTATSTPPLIRTLSQDMTAWMCYRSLFTKDSTNRNEYLDDLYKVAGETLQDIRDGKIDIANSAGSVVSEAGGSDRVYSTTEGHAPFFERDDELNWKFDKDLVDGVTDLRA